MCSITAARLRFPVGVGKAGMTWTGNARVEGKFVRPAWAPPDSIRAENPRLPRVIPGGSPHNPMGAAALTLRGGEYAIHGTNRPELIGGFVSHGCIRMYNADIRALYRWSRSARRWSSSASAASAAPAFAPAAGIAARIAAFEQRLGHIGRARGRHVGIDPPAIFVLPDARNADRAFRQ